MKKLLLFVAMLLPMAACAEEVEIDGIYYNIIADNQIAEVVYTYDCSGDIIIPASVTYEGIEYSVTSIGEKAFYHCSSITSITIPNSVMSIGYAALAFCSSLTSITIPNSVTEIGTYAFAHCWSLTSIIISNSVTRIGEGLFRGCINLSSITIPNSVTSIGYAAFSSCEKLSSITIPNSVTTIESNAFQYCQKVTDVYCYAKYVPYTESDAFDPNFEYTTLHVPENSVYLYKKTKPWSGFGNILAIIPGDANGDGLVNVTDIVSTVNFIMEKPSQDFNEYAADLNDDGVVNVTDIVKMVNIIMEVAAREMEE